MKNSQFIFITILILSLVSLIASSQNDEDDDKHFGEQNINFVPDSATAVKIAEVIWLPIYGKEIEKKKPYKAKLINDTTWSVQSSSPYLHGDVYVIEINKKNGHIYYVAHEK